MKIAYHEEALIGLTTHRNREMEERMEKLERSLQRMGRPNWNQGPQARTHIAETQRYGGPKKEPPCAAAQAMIGFSKDLPPPSYPRDDATRSKGKSPKDKGARPCRHCGSPNHWDNECKYARKGARMAKTHFVEPSPDYLSAQDAYEEAYYETESEEEEINEENLGREEDDGQNLN